MGVGFYYLGVLIYCMIILDFITWECFYLLIGS
jgi:hypothetical protein